ncbi:MAG: MG2 domain-containing protein, partial [Flavobacteriaceae bacterium]
MSRFFSSILLIIATFLPFSASAQVEEMEIPRTNVAEKIYLQLSSNVFAQGQTLWFKAVVTDAENHLPSKLSAVLYIELVSPEGQIVDRKLVKLKDGIGHGSLELPKNYPPGSYQLRAYTQWNRNFGDDFMFTTYIDLYEASGETNIRNIALAKSLPTALPDTTLKTERTPKVAFFPESGKLVHGFQNRIGFKALDANGLGIMAVGEVFNNGGKRVALFKSNHLGMGFFYMLPDSTSEYHARISFPNKSRQTIDVALPKVDKKSSMLSVSRFRDKVKFRVSSNTLDGKVYIKASSRGVEYLLIEGYLKGGTLETALAADELPEGILDFTLLDEDR